LRTEKKSIAINKILSWRILGTIVTIILVYVFTKRTDIAVMVGCAEIALKLILYYFHEKIWNRKQKSFTPFVLWFTGLSGAGKSTIADKVYDYLKSIDVKVERIDGDSVRSIFPQTGFTREDRNTHIRRIGYLASILEKNGIIVLASFVSPYNESRNFVRSQCKNYIEVYVNASLEKCEEREVKGLYAKARKNEINNFTGISDPFEIPENPEIILNTDKETIEESCNKIVDYMRRYLG
jgi:adenylylsulfate kinase